MHIPGYVYRWRASYLRHRSRALTQRMINQLPSDIRKDIGWPDGVDERLDLQKPSRC